MSNPRDTQAWKRLRRRVVAEEPVCWLKLPGCTTGSTVADHVQPVATHPELALMRSNLRGACASCNRKRGGFPLERMRDADDRPLWKCSKCGELLAGPALLVFHEAGAEAVKVTR